MNQVKRNRHWLTISPLTAVFIYIAGALCVMAYGWTRTPFDVPALSVLSISSLRYWGLP